MTDDSPGKNGHDIQIVLLAAVAENGVIGSDGEIPWYYPEDLTHFKETTMGHPVIMGRRTYESIRERLGGPLSGRTNVVLSRSGFAPDEPVIDDDTAVVVAESVADAIASAAEQNTAVAYVAGGATVYEQCLPLADRMVITDIPESPDGDTYFPEWDPHDWTVLDRQGTGELTFVTYQRANGSKPSN